VKVLFGNLLAHGTIRVSDSSGLLYLLSCPRSATNIPRAHPTAIKFFPPLSTVMTYQRHSQMQERAQQTEKYGASDLSGEMRIRIVSYTMRHSPEKLLRKNSLFEYLKTFDISQGNASTGIYTYRIGLRSDFSYGNCIHQVIMPLLSPSFTIGV
jgi:hypothetical protein